MNHSARQTNATILNALPKENLIFLPMTAADIEPVWSIEKLAYPFPWTKNNFEDVLKCNYIANCVYLNQQLVGYFIAMSVIDEWHLLNLCVTPAFQQRGLGKKILAKAHDYGRLKHASIAILEVRKSNLSAQKLYFRFGYELIGCRANYYQANNGKREDALVMTCQLL